jgi:RES domain-containing protein
MPRAFRLVKRKHERHAWDGEGARLFGGRWNSPGVALVYASESAALAALELLVHLGSESILEAYALCGAEFPESIVEELPPRALPRDWRAHPPPARLRELGDGWAREARSALLRVPSAVVPTEHNYLLNPAHRDFRRVLRSAPRPFGIDPRLARRRV